jgi:indolepyruvate ferredoxin oxidoreductase, beta subunit
MTTVRPITILVAALGGEGGGVLSDWIVAAARACGFPVQSTSIPGVAQRTGATTYYIEIMPVSRTDLGGRRPVLALTPGVGDVDLIVASEFLEAGRTIAGGFADPARTTVIASTHRAYAIAERMAMGDGRYDDTRLRAAIARESARHVLFDMEAAAAGAGAMTNAVMLGAIAASCSLPIGRDVFAAAIRADGKAVDANLRGFAAGHAAAERAAPGAPPSRFPARLAAARAVAASSTIPPAARGIVEEGVRRLAAYQDDAYAALYVDRLATIFDADRASNAYGRLAAAVARHLAVRMSYEDVIRVAEAKIAPERFARIAEEVGAAAGEPVRIVDYLKPGIDELCQLLPPALARRVLAFAQRRGLVGRLNWGMEIKTHTVTGYLRFWCLASLKRWRRRGYRFAEEQRAIAAWLALVVAAARLSGDLAVEVAECARLIKGYGDTWQRGTANYGAIEERVIRPVLDGRMSAAAGVDAVASARTAALLDPDGDSLAKCLAAIEAGAGLALAAE